jgi:pSer/pThr/pTyr-binding forkhead associated (FHA) protein
MLRIRSLGATLEIAGGAPVELLAASITLGRAAGNVIRLDDPEVSARHAMILFSGDGFRIHDLGSRNGTRVNGDSVTERRLESGDEIVLGGTTLRFEAE